MAEFERLQKAYRKVFDEHGNVRACGRKACIALIEECEERDPNTNYGNTKTGEMRTGVIKMLYKSLLQEAKS